MQNKIPQIDLIDNVFPISKGRIGIRRNKVNVTVEGTLNKEDLIQIIAIPGFDKIKRSGAGLSVQFEAE
jgi:hypothetical protein